MYTDIEPHSLTSPTTDFERNGFYSLFEKSSTPNMDSLHTTKNRTTATSTPIALKPRTNSSSWEWSLAWLSTTRPSLTWLCLRLHSENYSPLLQPTQDLQHPPHAQVLGILLTTLRNGNHLSQEGYVSFSNTKATSKIPFVGTLSRRVIAMDNPSKSLFARMERIDL